MSYEIAVIYLSFIGLLVTIAVVRNLPRAFTQYRNTDAYVHFIIIRAIRNNGFRIPKSISQSLLPGRFSYPCLVHWLLAVFPEDKYEAIDEYFSGIIDLIYGLFIISLVPFGLLRPFETILVLILFLTTPQFGRPDHPHGIGFSSRKVGLLFYSISVVMFLLWIQRGVPAFLAASLFSGVLIVLSSRFSLQAYVFTFAGFALFVTHTSIPVFVGVLVLSIILSKGFAIKILSDHLYYMYEYATGQQYTRFYNGLKSLDTLKRLINARSVRDIQETVYDSILLRAIFDNPFLVLLASSGYVLWSAEVTISLLPGTWVWIFSGFFATLLTSSYHFRFIGAADRYLEHVFLPSAIVIARTASVAGTWARGLLVAVVLYGIAFILFYMYFHVHIQAYSTERARKVEELTEVLCRYDPGNVVCQPRHLGSEIAWRTKHRVNDFIGNVTRSVSDVRKRQRMFPVKEMWVTDEVEWLSETFDPDWTVFMKKKEGPGLQPPEIDPEYENEYVSLYTFDDVLAAHSEK